MRALIATLGLSIFLAAAAPAQVVERPPAQQQPQPSDTIKVPQFRTEPPVSPLGAMWRSLLLPGWGQSVLGRRVTGAVFIFWEGLTLTMVVKSAHQLDYFRSIDDGSDEMAEKITGKKQEIEDWAVLLVFNHLLAAAEAYVSGVLWDFPADLAVRALPSGDVMAGVSLYW
jgi:hypothetical protein